MLGHPGRVRRLSPLSRVLAERCLAPSQGAGDWHARSAGVHVLQACVLQRKATKCLKVRWWCCY